MKSTELRPGMAVKIDGSLFVITHFQHVTPGNLRAFVQVKIRNLSNGTIIEKRLRSGEDIERIDLDRREMEYLYSSGAAHVFMDQQSYEQLEISGDLVGDSMKYLKPNTAVTVLIAEGNPLSVELPSVVELLVSETTPAVAGATVTNQLKEATAETGLRMRVPQFIKIGDVVRISTDDGSYRSRA